MEIRDCMKRKVYSSPATATIRQAAAIFVEKHVGMLPVVDAQDQPIGVIRLADLLALELPDSFNLLPDLDFVHDFGAVETTRPAPVELDKPVTMIMQPITFVEESCGLLRAYALMLKHDLHDLPVVSAGKVLVGIASRVDIGTAILSNWNTVGP